MAIISLEGLEFFAFHGAYPEEQKNGNRFLVDVTLEADCSISAQTDKLQDTTDYAKIYQIVQAEMVVRSNLLEHLARRIGEGIKTGFPTVVSCTVKVSKMNPPIGGKCDKVSVSWP